jgi:Tfp pilus assembly protein PilF
MLAIAAALLFFFQAPDPAAAGSKALDEGRYDAAAEAFAQAVKAEPNDYFAHFNLALAYSYLKKDEAAIAEYKRALELQPGLYEAELNEGILLIRGKRPDEAVALLEHAVEQRPREFRPRFFLAQAYLETGDPGKAAEHFQVAVDLDPKAAEAHLGLARALSRDERLPEAESEYRRAGELDPQFRESLLELGAQYDKRNRVSEAIAIYKQFPQNAPAQRRLGELLLDSKQYADAVARLEQAYARDSASNRIPLAEAYLLNGQPDKASPLLQQALALDPKNLNLRMQYAHALRDLRQLPAAAAQLREAAGLVPDDGAIWNEFGAMLYLTGDFGGALSALDHARQTGGDTAGNAFFRAIILDRSRQLKPALEAYERFLSLSQGKNADQEFQARQRVRILQRQVDRR